MNRLQSRAVLALLACALLASCGGKKRPPAVATGPGSSRTAGGGSRSAPVVPIDNGPDLATRPPDETGPGVDIPESEGGPLGDIHFGFDQAALSDEARATLEKHALWLQNHRDAKVRIEGHCDERGTVEYNLALGERRAKAAYDYVVSLGVPADRLKTVSYGKEIQVCNEANEGCWQRNRRAKFTVTGKTTR